MTSTSTRIRPCLGALVVATAWLAASAAGAAGAAPPADPGVAQATGAAPSDATPAEATVRIASKRAAVEARYANRERECRERFVVTSCIDDARRERRKELDRLRTLQIEVDEARRRERVAERKAELAGKAAEDAKRDRERSAAAAARAASAGESPAAGGRPLEPRRASAPESAASAGGAASASATRRDAVLKPIGPVRRASGSAESRHGDEARSRAAFEARQRQAAEHREESATAAIRRMAARAPAAPLPVPSAASATKSTQGARRTIARPAPAASAAR
ncbi:MAG: hypothetical protein ACXWCO_21045 [Caldimonas sp.]